MDSLRKLILSALLLFCCCNSSFAATFVKIKSPQTGTIPVQFASVFKKGDVPLGATPTLDISNYQVNITKRWNDGSAKHVIYAGYVPVIAETEKTINVAFSGNAPVGTSLTAEDIETLAPNASVQCGSIGTVTLSGLLSSPIRTVISGPEMVEAHYHAMVGSSTQLSVWFYVKMWKNGEVFIRAIVDNGTFNTTTADQIYIPYVSIGLNTVWNNGGVEYTHHNNTRWVVDGWINSTDPEVKIKADTSYLMASRLVPNYWVHNPSVNDINSLSKTYTPGVKCDWSLNQQNTGYHAEIGLLTKWDAMYLTSGGDFDVYDSVIANSLALNSYAIVMRKTSGYTPKLSDYPAVSSASYTLYAGAISWDNSHHGSGGYLAYLLTGEYIYRDLMIDQSFTTWFTQGYWNGSGASRAIAGQTRAAAWTVRTISQAVAILPSDSGGIIDELRTLLGYNFTHYKNIAESIVPAGIGYFYEYNVNNYATGTVAPWQQNFYTAVLGMSVQLEPLTNIADGIALRDYAYRGIVGMFGDSIGYCFTRAGNYTVKSNPGSTDVNLWYKDWKTVEVETHGTVSCDNTLLGTVSSQPTLAAQGYWGIALAALSYAVEDGAIGAASGWNRVKNASNWSDIERSGWGSDPQFGLWPRDVAAATCSDGMQNGDETGVDCGGSCPACSQQPFTQGKRYRYRSIRNQN